MVKPVPKAATLAITRLPVAQQLVDMVRPSRLLLPPSLFSQKTEHASPRRPPSATAVRVSPTRQLSFSRGMRFLLPELLLPLSPPAPAVLPGAACPAGVQSRDHQGRHPKADNEWPAAPHPAPPHEPAAPHRLRCGWPARWHEQARAFNRRQPGWPALAQLCHSPILPCLPVGVLALLMLSSCYATLPAA